MNNHYTRTETLQKIVDTVYHKLDQDLSMEDLDWAISTLIGVKSYEEGDIIIKNRNEKQN